MRELELIKSGSPCDIDYYDLEIQTVKDFLEAERSLCANYADCKGKSAQCYRRLASLLAYYVVVRQEAYPIALEEEKKDLSATEAFANAKIWVFRKGEWIIVNGIANVIDEIIEFAKVIIDFQEGERRPFTDDGKVVEFGPGDAVHNAHLDLKDISSELK